jgi:GNAT superfamily N-acetyltransferase
MNAWPAPRRVFHDGWVLGFGCGFTGRANSVHPLYDGTLDVDDKIRFCESAYAAHHLPALFNMSPAASPVDLDGRLGARGYRAFNRTSVRVLDYGPQDAAGEGLFISEVADEWWLAHVARFRSLPDHHARMLAEIVKHITPPAAFATVASSDDVVACGLGVADGEWVGLFDIVTREDQRRRGNATRLIRGLLDWAGRYGAKRAYLQVMVENTPAIGFYDKLGFREAYQYRYRTSYR